MPCVEAWLPGRGSCRKRAMLDVTYGKQEEGYEVQSLVTLTILRDLLCRESEVG